MTAATPWLLREPTSPNTSVRLFCLPNAGGGASTFRSWVAQAPEFVEVVRVQLPGRESRLGEPPIDDLDELVDRLLEVLEAHQDLPYALFGHSMGAAVAYRMASVVAERSGSGPLRLFVSSFRAPHLREPLPAMSRMGQAQLLEALTRLGGTPAELMANDEYMGLMLPAVLADVRVAASITDRTGPPLSCPITAFGGRDDDSVPAASLDAWREHTAGAFRLRTFPGGHFYLAQQTEELLAEIGDALAFAMNFHEAQNR